MKINREILFKAKTLSGEWIEGYFAIIGKRNVIIKALPENYYTDELKERYGNEIFDIKPGTLCQFTGLTDKHKKKIWENDICIIHNNSIDEKDGYFVVKWDKDAASFALSGNSLVVIFNNFYGWQCEVVGNSFDHLGLLKEE